jgi:sulfur carrier protein
LEGLGSSDSGVVVGPTASSFSFRFLLTVVTLHINGTPRNLSELGTIADLVNELQLIPETILIEHNGVALRRDEWTTRTVRENDTIEVLQIVAGG